MFPAFVNPAMDALVENVVNAQDRKALQDGDASVGSVVVVELVPGAEWFSQDFHIAYWNRFGDPDIPIREGIQFRHLVGRSGEGGGARSGEAAVTRRVPSASEGGLNRMTAAKQDLQRYLNEFSFRYSHRITRGYDDTDRAILALKGDSGKRLTYRR